ncbi:MAG: hypothetical protein R3B13_19350 [Polyangiaceae bacterium]
MERRSIVTLGASIALVLLAQCSSSSSKSRTPTQDAGPTDASNDQAQPATCGDGVQNGDEIAVDCGGGCLCAAGQPCKEDVDCAQAACVAGKCQPPNCTDGIANGEESDADCGGPACPRCSAGKACTQATDCDSGVCKASICQVPSCGDGVANGNETGVDCGGPDCSAKCKNGSACKQPTDCESQVCQSDKCVPASCADKVKNGDETDLDCGGSCGGCDDGKTCGDAADCKSLVCTGNACTAAACPDGVKNGSETDLDCGGPGCPACADGKGCGDGGDCSSGVCLSNVCQVPNCTDTKSNGNETDIDCGGPLCPTCNTGQNCSQPTDCAGGTCTTTQCATWAKSFGDAGQDFPKRLAVDSKGNIVVLGGFTGDIDFGKGKLTAKASSDIFVAKFSPTGTTLWAVQLGGNQADSALALALTAQDDILIGGGSASTNLNLGGLTLPYAAGYDAFMAKLSGVDGSHVWSDAFGGDGDDYVRSIAVDKNGDLLVGGQFASTNFSHGGTFATKGGIDGFLMKASGGNGTATWAMTFGGANLDVVRSVAALPSGDMAFTGYISSDVTVGATLVPASSQDIIVGLISGSTLKETWVTSFGGTGADQGLDISAAGTNGVVLGGRFQNTINFGGANLVAQGYDSFVVKLGAVTGAHTWSTRQQSAGDDWMMSVTVDSKGDVYGMGLATGAMDAGGGALPVSTGRAPFVVKLGAASGNHLYSASFPATGNAASTDQALAVSPLADAVFATGAFASGITTPAASLTAVGGDEVYVMSLGRLP